MGIALRSLQWKLILTFLVVSVAGTLLTSLSVYTSNQRAFDQLRHEQREAMFVDAIESYYEVNGSWENADVRLWRELELVAQTPPTDGDERRQPEMPPPFALIDAQNQVVIPNRDVTGGGVVSADVLSNGLTLELGGEQIGTLLIDDQIGAPNSAESAFLAQTNRALLFGALGATAVAILLAIIIARTLIQPLEELAAASRELAQGKLNQAVPVRTQDELGELATAFNQMSSELDRLNQMREQMTADIAHDLRTPLTVLSGYLEAMEDGTLAPTPSRLQMMRQEVVVLQRLVADLRTLSLADAGRLALYKEPVAIGELLAQVQSAYQHQAGQQAVALVVNSAEKIPPVSLDAARIQQALGNLVSNALQHTSGDGRIMLAAKAGDAAIEISVADTGSGIPADDLPHIFNRFYRADSSRQEGQGGSGLGLAITKSIVAAHGGDIAVASTLGNGTRFAITLPV